MLGDSTALPLVVLPPLTGPARRVPALTEEARQGLAAFVAWGGEDAAYKTYEFLTARIRNPNTRRAYHHAAVAFTAWCAAQGLRLADVMPPDVARYIDALGATHAIPTVKQHLAGLKHWFDALVTGQVLPLNPAQAVRSPRYSVTTGLTPILERYEAKALLDSIDVTTLRGARDRALMAVMLFSFARVGAVLGMRVKDYRNAGTFSASFVLHEKGGKLHSVPAHAQAATYLDHYLTLSGLGQTLDAVLWQSVRHGRLTGKALYQSDACQMVKKRCRAAGLSDAICNHSFRATGITLHQDAGGDLEAARQIAGHASVKTTQIYNRSGDRKRRAEIDRVQL